MFIDVVNVKEVTSQIINLGKLYRLVWIGLDLSEKVIKCCSVCAQISYSVQHLLRSSFWWKSLEQVRVVANWDNLRDE